MGGALSGGVDTRGYHWTPWCIMSIPLVPLVLPIPMDTPSAPHGYPWCWYPWIPLVLRVPLVPLDTPGDPGNSHECPWCVT